MLLSSILNILLHILLNLVILNIVFNVMGRKGKNTSLEERNLVIYHHKRNKSLNEISKLVKQFGQLFIVLIYMAVELVRNHS